MTIDLLPFCQDLQNEEIGFVKCCDKDLVAKKPIPQEKEAYCPVLQRNIKVVVTGDRIRCSEWKCDNWNSKSI
jgi:hypothetical protein